MNLKKVLYLVIAAILLFSSIVSLSFADNALTEDNDVEIEVDEKIIELTLEDVIEIGLEDNPTIEQAKLELEKNKVAYEKGELFLKKNKDDMKEEHGENSSTYLEQITKNEISNDLSWEIAQKEYQNTIDIQIRLVEKKYFDVLHAENTVEIYEENLNLTKELYEKTSKELKVGKVTETELLTSELNYEKALNNLDAAKKGLESVKMELNIMLGYELMKEIVLLDELEYKAFEEMDIDSVVSEVLENSIDLLKAKLTYETAKIEMQVATKKYPEITFEYRSREVALKKAEHTVEVTKKVVEKDLRNKYSEVIQKKNDIETSKKAVDISKQVLETTTLSYDLGLKVLTDVQSAQIKLQSEKLNLAKDILDYNISILEFEEHLENK